MAQNPILWLILTILEFYTYIIFASVILSWLVAFQVVNTRNRFVYIVNDVLYRLTEPALSRIRRYMPHLGGVDLSPIILIALVFFARLSVIWVYVRIP